MDIEAYLKRDYISNLINDGKRLDDRLFDEYRKISIEKDYSGAKASGSSMIHLGDTKVLVGISLDVGEPYPDSPESGVMTTSAELRPLAFPHFESGPPGEEAIEIARVVDRGIRESGAIDLEKLFIEDGKVWVVFIDIHVLDHDGNLIDASGIAAISALLGTKMPKYEDGEVIYSEKKDNLPVVEKPIPCTIAKIGESLIVDPTLDEEYAMTARLTTTTTAMINAMQKGGNGSLTTDEVDRAIDLAFEKAKEIRKLL